MDVSLYLDADDASVDGSRGDGNGYALDFSRIHVGMAGEASCNGDEIAGATVRCEHCGDKLDEDGAGLEDGRLGCRSNDQAAVHEPEPMPCSFANSASISVDEEHDEVTVTISVGDPRGAFAMTVSRGHDGKLRLAVPYEGMGFAHMPLTKLDDGYYQIGD